MRLLSPCLFQAHLWFAPPKQIIDPNQQVYLDRCEIINLCVQLDILQVLFTASVRYWVEIQKRNFIPPHTIGEITVRKQPNCYHYCFQRGWVVWLIQGSFGTGSHCTSYPRQRQKHSVYWAHWNVQHFSTGYSGMEPAREFSSVISDSKKKWKYYVLID